MKKLFTILSVIMLIFSVSAQEFGVQAGMNMANLSGEDMETDMKMGIFGGVSAAFSLTDVITLETGALYSTKGAQDEESEEEIGIKMSLAFSYIVIPLNIAYSVSDQISLIAGSYVGLLMSANSKMSGEFLGQTIDEEEDIKEDIANIDFGINIGASFSINESISVGVGYELGLADIGSEGDFDATHSNIHIGMSYSFGG
jgi:opacity protein-like surface antigen